jgi:hypothetical protein
MRVATHDRDGRACLERPAARDRVFRVLFALTVAAVLAFGATACSGDTPAGDTPADEGRSTETYSNDDYDFSLTYDTLMTQGEPGDGGGAGAVFDVAFVDETGQRAGEAYVDGVKVTVFESSREVKPDEVPGLKEQVHAVVDERVAQLPSGKVAQSLSRTTVNGTPGFTLSYSYVQDGVPVSAVSTFLFSGRYQYEVTGQATKKDWAVLQPALEAALASFTVD